jgi:hypothetical protein
MEAIGIGFLMELFLFTEKNSYNNTWAWRRGFLYGT